MKSGWMILMISLFFIFTSSVLVLNKNIKNNNFAVNNIKQSITLTLKWMPIICFKYSKFCFRKNANYFVLTKLSVTDPISHKSIKNCSGKTNIDDLMIEMQLKMKLKILWPNMQGKMNYEEFLIKKWKKYGKCFPSKSNDNAENQYYFFSTIIALYDKLNINKIISNNPNLLPVNQYYLNKIMMNIYKVNPQFTCIYNEGKQYISSIKFHYNEKLESIYYYGSSNCRRDALIYLI